MSVELIREYWGYHHWANRRLFDVVAALGEPAAARDARAHVRRRLVLARDVARSAPGDRARRPHVRSRYPRARRSATPLGRARGRPARLSRGSRLDRSVEARRRHDAGGPDLHPPAGYAAPPRPDPCGPSPERAGHHAHDGE